VLGAQARAQYGALARLRWHMFSNGLRTNKGVLELGARTLAFILYAGMGLGLGAGAGGAAYLVASREEWRFLPVLFWAVFFIWQMVPVLLASFQEQFDLGILLRFPVRFGSYLLLYLVFGLADVSTILGGLCCCGVWVGITAAHPELLLWTTLGLAVFAAFNILLVRAIFAWIDRWLAQRKTREILGAIFMVALLGLQLLNPAIYQKRHQEHRNALEQAQEYQRTKAQLKARYGPWLHTANAVQKWLPPGLAAQALGQAAEQQPGPGLGSLGVLGLYVLAAGGVLTARLKAEYRGESLGTAPSRDKAARMRTKAAASPGNIDAGNISRREGAWTPRGSGPVAAVMEKELRVLLRTLPLLYAVGAPLLLVLVFSTIFVRNGGAQGPVFPLALPVCMVYAQLGFTQLFYNNLGAEGAGIQLCFLSPTPIRTVLLGKNLFHSLLFGLVALLAAVLTGLRLGIPDGAVVSATGAWLVFALPSNLAAGNIFSLTMPYRVNPGRLSRQRGSQANALLALLVQMGFLAVGAAAFALSWSLDRQWLATPIFLALAVGAVLAWMRVLGNADAIANQRRDALMATLMKTE
jgi:ABC-2 type transport system permease protein